MTQQPLSLEEQIQKHDKLYWELGMPEISDTDYDLLVEQLRALAPGHPLVNRINTPTVSAGKIKHLRPMRSLDKCYTEAELLAWAKSVARGPEEVFLVQRKKDGWSGEFQDADTLVTRGDGEEGDDISHIASSIDIRGYHDFSTGPMYGEIVLLKSTFLAARAKNLLPYKNTRSALGGIIRNASAPKEWHELLTFVPFDYYSETVTLAEMPGVDWAGVLEGFAAGDIPTDGAVITLADREYGESLGATDHHPKHSIALKHKNPTAVTKLLDVYWQCGKGRISPVAQLEPVECDGITISQSTLHNLNFIAKLGLQIGDTVKIGKLGDVIPGILSVHEEGKRRFPIVCSACPACGHVLHRAQQNYVCPNSACPGTAGKRLHDSLVRLGVENIGPATCALLVEAGADTVPDVFSLTEFGWRQIPGFAERSAKQTFEHLRLLKNSPIEDYRLLAAMNFEGVGLTLSKKILDKVSLAALPVTDLTEIEGVGETIASKIDLVENEDWQALLLTFPLITPTQGATKRPTVCFTGADPGGRTRDEWAKLAEAAGYVFSGTVTKTLTVLVAASTTTTKAVKAQKYGTRVLSYSEFQLELEGENEDA